ncbi:hypothetical protein D3C84_936060 [compost metagenome]
MPAALSLGVTVALRVSPPSGSLTTMLVRSRAPPSSATVCVWLRLLALGASLSGVTLTVLTMFGSAVWLLVPLSVMLVMVTTRLLAPGFSLALR